MLNFLRNKLTTIGLAGTTGSRKTTTLLQTMLGIVAQMQKEPDTAPPALPFSIRTVVPSRSCCRTFHPHSTKRSTLSHLARPSTRAPKSGCLG